MEMKIKLDEGAKMPTRAHSVRAGYKISQLVVTPIIIPTLKFVDELEDTERGDKGFGSSGR